MAQRKTDEVIISLKINNKQAAASISELEGDLRLLQNHMKGLNPEVDKQHFEAVQKQYGALKDRITQVKEEVGLLQKKIETPIDPKSLSGLEKKASELKKALNEINPDVDKAKFDKLKAEYEGVQGEIVQTKEKLGFVKKAEKEVETGAFGIGEAFKQMATAAFWIAFIQQIYELAKAFFEVQKEINGLQTQIGKMTGTTGKELDQLVGKTQGISKAFEVESDKVNNTANSIAKNMKISFAEAQELIKKGLAASAETDKGELLDWYEEYASTLSGAGFKAEEFIAIVSQMKEQGVYTDFGIDAVKEFGIRVTTETEKVVKALKAVEGSTKTTFAEQMVKDLETGKISVADAMNVVTTELAKIPENSNLAKYAIAELFGSKGEDVGVAYIQNLSKLGNATDYLNQSSKGLNTQLDQLIQSQQTLTATQSELFGKMQSGSKFIDILTNKALTVLYKLMILIVDNSKPLVDVFENYKRSVMVLTTEIMSLLRSFGLMGKEGDMVKGIIETLARSMAIAQIPFKVISFIVSGLSFLFRQFINVVSETWQELVAGSPRLQHLGEKMDNLGKKLAPIAQFFIDLKNSIFGAIDALTKFIGEAQKAEELAGASGNFKSEIEAKRAQELKDQEQAYSDRENKSEYTSEEQKVEYEAGSGAGSGSAQKPDYTAQSQAYQDYLQKQKDAKAKADAEKLKKEEEAKKKAEELAKAEVDARNKAVDEIVEKSKELDALAQKLEEDDKAELERAEAIINAEKERLSLEQQKIDLQLQALEQNEKPQSETEDQSAYLYQKYQLEQDARDLALEQKLLDTTYSEEQEFLIKEEYRLANEAAEKEHSDIMIAEKWRVATAQAQAIGVMFGAFSDSTKAIVELFGEQTEAGKIAAGAMKAFSAGEIAANAVVEISNAWVRAGDPKNPLSFIPGAAQAVAIAETIGIVARKAKALGELGSIKFKEGGFLRGRSHDQGGIRGTGRFSNIEVEGGEFITNKRATALNLPVLEAINKYGDQLDFSRMIHFATGGQIPNTTPSSAAVQAIRTPEPNPMGEMLLMEMMAMRQALDSYEREKQIFMNYSQVENAADKMATVREY